MKHELWWNDDDAFRSRLFDAISLLLPDGERFVITAMSDWLRNAQREPGSPTALLSEVQRFKREEEAHSRAHRLYNERLAMHAPSRRLEQRVASIVDQMAGWDLTTRMAFAAAFEHLTALLSVEALRARSAWLGVGAAPQIRLWRWHCQEEIDHRHVALDVLKAMRIGHGRRTAAFLAAMFYLGSDLAVLLSVLLWADLRARHVGLGRLMAQAAVFAVRALPSLMRMAWGSVRYLAALEPAR